MLANLGSGIVSRLIRWSCHVRTQEPAWQVGQVEMPCQEPAWQVGQVQVKVAGCFSTTSRLTWKLGKSRIKFLHLASCDHKQHIGQLVGHLSAKMGNGGLVEQTQRQRMTLTSFMRLKGGVRYCKSCTGQKHWHGQERWNGKKPKHKNNLITSV